MGISFRSRSPLAERHSQERPFSWMERAFIISWAGMRGVVSLATALSIPLYLSDGMPFPLRNLVIFITFVVILVTLVFQGLTLPLVVKLISLNEIDDIVSEDEQQAGIRIRLNTVALDILKQKYVSQVSENELVGFLKNELENETEATQKQLDSLECDETESKEIELYHHVLADIYSQQRQALFQLRKQNVFSDEQIRKAEMQIDLNELKISDTNH